MKLDIYLSKFKNIEAENKLLKFAIIVIGIVTIINTGLLYSSLNSHRTVIVPPVIHSQFEVYGNKATDEYYKEFARYISTLALSYTPVTVRSQFTELLGMFSADRYNEAKSRFYEIAEKIETSKVSSVFYLSNVAVDDEHKEMHVTGVQMQYANDGTKFEEKTKTYIIKYVMNNGRFAVTEIYEKGA